MISEGLIVALVVALGLLILGYRMKSLPIITISSIGWLISALQLYQQTAEVLPMILLIMLAISQFFILNKKGD